MGAVLAAMQKGAGQGIVCPAYWTVQRKALVSAHGLG